MITSIQAQKRITSRREYALHLIRNYLRDGGELTVPVLAESLSKLEGTPTNTIRRWVSENRENLSAGSDSMFVPGRRALAGRFARLDNRS